MNITEFISLLKNPVAVSEQQTIALERIINDYPYFQAARVLHLKGLKDQYSFRYNNALKTAAAYTTNRSVLFDFITSQTLDIDETSAKEKKLITESEVIDLEVVDTINKEQISKPQIAPVEDVKVAEETLKIGKPLVFDVSEMHSFYEWLQLTTVKPIVREEVKKNIEEAKLISEKENKFDLIEQFINSKPKIHPTETNEIVDISIESTIENENLMTETLARVYLEQKKYDKAMQAFKILSLKYPEKSSFFANRIKAIKFLQKNNT